MTPAGPDLRDAAAQAAALLHREGAALDRRDWAAWLDLYEEDAVFWVPAWRDDGTTTDDPDREISWIYHPSKAGLVERVRRITSQKSVTAMPLPRTAHFVSNVVADAAEAGGLQVAATWCVMTVHPRTAEQHTLFGRYEVRMTRRPGAPLRIAAKKVVLVNDRVSTLIDVYCL
ncbi:aromatic-ring-hydroxylating dioxygenase subunit beta [Aquabacterium sp. J223]|uniref:aromatic-ring-hydroxylating dioxygenase subunit beta n=1 Tax=Aquabacterium sp. J223 TaxID=2898431 RepID=UPI0021AE0C19|nr:aromatic-ring-hydroxylating dioxygenase subunit beta [Aquabacterium sp. J223]UUX94971.1 aromatic-ring-hydroxylating dioxygenase subunit beta [Aquabacterium sp. J223]